MVIILLAWFPHFLQKYILSRNFLVIRGMNLKTY